MHVYIYFCYRLTLNEKIIQCMNEWKWMRTNENWIGLVRFGWSDSLNFAGCVHVCVCVAHSFVYQQFGINVPFAYKIQWIFAFNFDRLIGTGTQMSMLLVAFDSKVICYSMYFFFSSFSSFSLLCCAVALYNFRFNNVCFGWRFYCLW